MAELTDGVHIGVDIGGTKVIAATVADDGAVGPLARRSTPGRRVEVELVEDALTEAIQEAAAGRPIAAVGIAAAGFVDADGERVMFAPHLPWRDDPTRSRLETRWGLPVALDNDANCAARAELALGAARGAGDVLMVTMGTGIGGAVVLGGTLLRGRNGMAGEFGHMQVVPDGRGCECGGEKPERRRQQRPGAFKAGENQDGGEGGKACENERDRRQGQAVGREPARAAPDQMEIDHP